MLLLVVVMGGGAGIVVVVLLVVLLLVLLLDACIFGAGMVIDVGVGAGVTAGAGCVGGGGGGSCEKCTGWGLWMMFTVLVYFYGRWAMCVALRGVTCSLAWPPSPYPHVAFPPFLLEKARGVLCLSCFLVQPCLGRGANFGPSIS